MRKRMTKMILNRGEVVSSRRGGYALENNYHLLMYFMLL